MRKTARPKYTFLFIATCDAPTAIPVIVRTQAHTENEARANLAGGFTLDFVAKLRTDTPFFDSWVDDDACTLWSIQGTDIAYMKEIAGLHHA